MLALSLLVSACNPPIPEDTGSTGSDTATTAGDVDGDGYDTEGGDCDDADPTVSPAAAETLDGRDEDCSGVADDAIAASDVATSTGSVVSLGYTLAVGHDRSDNAVLLVGSPGDGGAVSAYDPSDLATGNASATLTLSRVAAAGSFGAEVALARLDADGSPELIAGAPAANAGDGAVYVLPGTRFVLGGNLDADADARLLAGPEGGIAGFGRAVAATEDRLYVGAPADSAARGAFYTFDASDVAAGTVTSSVAGGVTPGGLTTALLGWDMAVLDWDADGADDLVVTAPLGSGGARQGGVALVWLDENLPGLDGGDTDLADVRIDGTTEDQQLGGVVLAPGDLTGDGYDDLVLASAPVQDLTERTIVVVQGDGAAGGHGTSGAIATISGIPMTSDSPDGLGMGDIDGDGVPELVAGAWGNDTGLVLVYDGARLVAGGTQDPSTADATIVDDRTGGLFGAGIGVVDADGSGGADVFLGAPGIGDGVLAYVPSGY